MNKQMSYLQLTTENIAWMQNKWIYLACFCFFGVVFIQLHSFIFLSIVMLMIYYLIGKSRKLAFSCLTVFLLFLIYYDLYDNANKSHMSYTQTSFSGKIITRPIINGDRLRLIFKTKHGEKLYFSYRIPSEAQKNSFSSLSNRMTCKFKGNITKPNGSRNFYEFDFKQYLYQQKIHWIVEPSEFSNSFCENKKQTLFDLFILNRDRSLEFIEEQFPKPLDGFVQALIFGERGLLEEETLQSYQNLGLIHLLAISGMHVSLLCAFVYFVLVRIGFTKEKVIYSLMFLLPLYSIMAGSTPSVVRATIMSILLLWKLLFRSFPLSALDLISIAFIVMITVNPYYIFQAGFQLSFIVTLALILSNQTILQKYKTPIGQLIAASTISQICSLPLVLYHFYQFSLLSIPLNLIYIPLITFIILPMCITLFFMIMIGQSIGIYLLPLSNELLKLMNITVNKIGDVNWQLLVLGRPGWILITMYIIIILYTFVAWEKKDSDKRALFLPLTILVSFHWISPYVIPKGEITFLDVGQGDSILIELPFRKEVYLIDTGGMVLYEQDEWKKKKKPFSISERIIIPYLKAKGIRKIDKLILTHSDLDHVGEAESLLGEIKIIQLVIGDYHEIDELEKKIIKKAKQKKVEVKKVKLGDSWEVSGTVFKVLSPDQEYLDKNEGSIVITTYLGGLSWLFTGDIEKEAEQNLIKNFPNLSVHVLKAAHHGSNTSTSDQLLQQLKPKSVIISAGVNNRYGHPTRKVLDRLMKHNVNIFRTDQQGAIRYTFFAERLGTFQTKIPYDKVKSNKKKK